MNTLLSKFLTIITAFGLCGVLIAIGGCSEQSGRDAGSSALSNGDTGSMERAVEGPVEKGISDRVAESLNIEIDPAAQEEFRLESEWLAGEGSEEMFNRIRDKGRKRAELMERVTSAARMMHANPGLAADLTERILSGNNPGECRLMISALAVAGAKNSLLKILVSDADSLLKALAACAYAWEPSAKTRVKLRIDNIGMLFPVGGIEDETALQAIWTEWQYTDTDNYQVKRVLFKLMELSSIRSDAAADTLWEWVLEGNDKSEVLRRASNISRFLKANPNMQIFLMNELLDMKNQDIVRSAAAVIMKESSVETIAGEEAFQALRTEWKSMEEGEMKTSLIDIMKISAAGSDVAAGTVWEWVLEGSNKSEALRRAGEVSQFLKANPNMQKILMDKLLDSGNEALLRLAAAAILKEGSVETIADEEAFQALRTEWESTEDGKMKALLTDLMKVSAAGSDIAATIAWEWVLEGNGKSEVLRRAEEVSQFLKANSNMQKILMNKLLDGGNEEVVRLAAAMILKEGSVETHVAEAAFQMLRTEWENTEDREMKTLLTDLMKVSAAGSDVAAGTAWEWVLEGKDESETLRRAKEVSQSLKANPNMQEILTAELLDGGNRKVRRITAASVLKTSSVPTLEETKKRLASAANDDTSDVLTRSLAFYGLDSSVDSLSRLNLKTLNAIIASKDVPSEIRISAMNEIRRRAPEITGR